MSVQRDSIDKSNYGVELRVNNGVYIDDGCLIFKFNVNPMEWDGEKVGQSILVKPKKNATIKASYKFDKILHTEEENIIEIPKTLFRFSKDEGTGKPVVEIVLEDLNR